MTITPELVANAAAKAYLENEGAETIAAIIAAQVTRDTAQALRDAQLLNLAEVAKLLCVGMARAREILSSHRIPTVTIGERTQRWRVTEIESLIARLEG